MSETGSDYIHSVLLERDKCVGCTNCIKRCPTRAIRVRGGKAQILSERCIDCGECVRICGHHAKIPVYDPLSRMDDFEYKVALPAPSLYGQFNELTDVNILLSALLKMGFDRVFEVAYAAEVVSALSRTYVEEHPEQWPIISTACPAIVKLIYTSYTGLIDHLLPIQPPVEIAAAFAREQVMKDTGLPSEKIGIFFISPCPAKVSSCREPIGVKKTEVDAVLAIKDVYLKLVPLMTQVAADMDHMEDLSKAGRIGIGWGVSGGEAAGLINDSYLAADGIENCKQVLNDLEDDKYPHLRFVELDACPGGCVGGVLTVENPYLAKTKMTALRKYMPVSGAPSATPGIGNWTEEVEPRPFSSFGGNFKENLAMVMKVEELTSHFPGLDCGACGAPTCHSLAGDIVRGEAKETDCIYVLMEYIRRFASEVTRSVTVGPSESDSPDLEGGK